MEATGQDPIDGLTPQERRLRVATNAVAGALYGVATGEAPTRITDEQAEACRAIALRVLDHIDRYDAG